MASDRHDSHKTVQQALDIAIRTLQRDFPCERATATPRSACWCVAVDTQGVHYTKIDPRPMCRPCQIVWHLQHASVELHGVEYDEDEELRDRDRKEC